MAFNYLRAVKILPIFLSFELFFSLNTLQPVYAQSISETGKTQEKVIQTRVNFQPPSNEKPNGSMPGGSRDGLMLLVPEHQREQGEQGEQGEQEPIVFGLTTKAKPVFFINVTKSDIQEIDFILIDQEAQEIIYKNSIDLSGNTGIIGIPLPVEAPSLEVGKTYIISFQVPGAFVNGLIKRVELNSDISSQLEGASPLEKAVLYAENGIWFETLEILDELKRSQPENAMLAADWDQLLKIVETGENTAQKTDTIQQ